MSIFKHSATPVSATSATQVAVKLFYQGTELRDAETILEPLLALSHPHLIELLDFGRQQDRLFVVNTLVTDGSLTSYLRDVA